jgi:hypothetical protein
MSAARASAGAAAVLTRELIRYACAVEEGGGKLRISEIDAVLV